MKKNKGKYHIIMMCCGYAESAMSSWLIYTSIIGNVTFATKVDAVKALALDMYNKYIDDMDVRTVRQCPECKEIRGGDFCFKCGANLLAIQTLDAGEFKDWIVSLHSTNCDNYGEAEYANGEDLTFWPWRADEIVSAKQNEIVLLCENAQHILTEALYDQKPELMDEETKHELEQHLNDAHRHHTDWQKMKMTGE